MKKKKIRDLGDWPPQPMGSFTNSLNVPNANESVLTKVVGVIKNTVSFEGQFKSQTHKYDFEVPTPEIADKVAEVLRKNIKTILELGEQEVEID